jgi:hypothetical protein
MTTMRKFAVVTDSTADIEQRIALERGISVVPLSVSFGSETLLDGVLSQREFFDRMNAAPLLPTTSQPPVGLFVEAYERALQDAENVISVHISNKLSGTIDSASLEGVGGVVHLAGAGIGDHRWTDEYKLQILQSHVRKLAALLEETRARATEAASRRQAPDRPK